MPSDNPNENNQGGGQNGHYTKNKNPNLIHSANPLTSTTRLLFTRQKDSHSHFLTCLLSHTEKTLSLLHFLFLSRRRTDDAQLSSLSFLLPLSLSHAAQLLHSLTSSSSENNSARRPIVASSLTTFAPYRRSPRGAPSLLQSSPSAAENRHSLPQNPRRDCRLPERNRSPSTTSAWSPASSSFLNFSHLSHFWVRTGNQSRSLSSPLPHGGTLSLYHLLPWFSSSTLPDISSPPILSVILLFSLGSVLDRLHCQRNTSTYLPNPSLAAFLAHRSLAGRKFASGRVKTNLGRAEQTSSSQVKSLPLLMLELLF